MKKLLNFALLFMLLFALVIIPGDLIVTPIVDTGIELSAPVIAPASEGPLITSTAILDMEKDTQLYVDMVALGLILTITTSYIARKPLTLKGISAISGARALDIRGPLKFPISA